MTTPGSATGTAARGGLRLGHPLRHREPAAGYASRLAALNGVDLRRLLGDMRIDADALARGDAGALDDLADLRGLGADGREALRRYTPTRAPGDTIITLAGNRFPPGPARLSAMRVCPHCIAEDLAGFEGPRRARPWSRLEWTLEPIRSCARHGTLLLDVQPETTLRSGHDFSLAIALRVLPGLDRLRDKAAPAPGTAFSSWFVARLDGILDPGNWLDDAPLHAAAAFCEALGISVRFDPGTLRSTLGPGELARAAEEGYRIASEGAAAVDAALDEVLGRHRFRRRGSVGHEKVYGRVHRVLRTTSGDPAFDKFREALREHAFAKLPMSPATAFLGIRLGERRMHTQRSAAFSCSRSDAGLIRLVGPEAVADGKRLLITVEEFGRIVESVEHHLTAKQVAARTGFGVGMIKQLEAATLLPVMPEADRRAGPKRRFLRSDVDAFMARLFRNAVPTANPSGSRMTVTQAASGLRVGTVEILDLILRDRLEWVGRHTTGDRYGDLLVDRDNLLRVVRQAVDPDDVTDADALATLVGVAPENLWRLVGAGFLAWSPGYDPRNTRSVRALARASVEAFASEYVTLWEIALSMGVPASVALRRLGDAGIRESVAYEGIRTRIYRRREVAALLMAVDAA